MAHTVRVGATQGLSREPSLSYRDVGVASSDEMRSFGSAIELFKSTRNFSRLVAPDSLHGVAEPYASVLPLSADLSLAIATDGVGTKILVAEELHRYDTVGIDCVAMNANDIICVGAEPIAMVDYMAVKAADTEQLKDLAEGLVEGARQAHVSIPGGETAQVGEMLADSEDAFDLVGTCVGTMAPKAEIVGQSIRAGDALIGYASTGIHSNGLTLARRAFRSKGWPLERYVEDFGRTLGEELLAPTRIYVDLAQDLRRALDVHAFAHITSDGFINLNRVPPEVGERVGFEITDLPSIPPVFHLIGELGEIPAAEMFRVFNMGVGFCAVVPEAEAERALAIGTAQGIESTRLGSVTTECPGEVTIHANGVHLRSEGKRFVPIG
ncbi:MAG: phosphoribosylformylglycinamidine cyclo-ligase [Dehalococcoidia bacterium]|nr:phosphoribosylformylglycinamidine cyclo-ligase [Dehalococcoidia bacterium]MYA51951.1 phosphoribosylformylglycinamidine cyclo-ligase [Dehalococcoidia bacterium]MYH68197.1 phosphoribosylformylglycinamidine cyclo-ligase [Dehalococcoidia bacterium]